MAMKRKVAIGTGLAGYCGGYFGPGSYADKWVEALGPDWVVARDRAGKVHVAAVEPDVLCPYIGEAIRLPESERLYTETDINELSINGCFGR